jgi:ABC-type transport system involved in multi-copper enzyme maturation permease subunit
MILSAFTSEWTKLRRPTLLISTIAGLSAAASIFVILLFSQSRSSGGGGVPSLGQLAQPNGLVVGVDRATILLGVVAFGLASAQLASEYSLGTLRQLLIRQPRRSVLLLGKLLGVVTFLLLALVIAAVVAFIAALLAAHVREVPTAAWFSATGIEDLLRALGDIALAVIGFAILGIAVGEFVRSAVFAVIIGLAWLLPIEGAISRIVPSTAKWLPGQALGSIAQGGSVSMPLATEITVGAGYVALALALTFWLFSRRDVTA